MVEPRGWRVGPRREPPDQVAVDRCIDGELPANRLSTAERRLVAATLAGRGMSDTKIAELTGWVSKDAVAAFRRRHRIPAGVGASAKRPPLGQRAAWWRDPAQRRERVAALAAAGHSDRRIGDAAGVDASTVRAYRCRAGIPAGNPRNSYGWR